MRSFYWSMGCCTNLDILLLGLDLGSLVKIRDHTKPAPGVSDHQADGPPPPPLRLCRWVLALHLEVALQEALHSIPRADSPASLLSVSVSVTIRATDKARERRLAEWSPTRRTAAKEKLERLVFIAELPGQQLGPATTDHSFISFFAKRIRIVNLTPLTLTP